MKLDNNIIEWNNPKITMPRQNSGYGYGLTVEVLTLLQDVGKTKGLNRYVMNFYDLVLEEWNIKNVIAWTYLKEYTHLQDYHIDDYC